MLTSDDDDIAARADQMRNHGAAISEEQRHDAAMPDRQPLPRPDLKLVQRPIGPVAVFKRATVVDRLPKTRSGKILRGTMQKIADDQPWKMPATIDDPAILDEITEVLHGAGIAS